MQTYCSKYTCLCRHMSLKENVRICVIRRICKAVNKSVDSPYQVCYYIACKRCRKHREHKMEPWCSGLTCLPVTQKIAGSNPVGSVRTSGLSQAAHWFLHIQR